MGIDIRIATFRTPQVCKYTQDYIQIRVLSFRYPRLYTYIHNCLINSVGHSTPDRRISFYYDFYLCITYKPFFLTKTSVPNKQLFINDMPKVGLSTYQIKTKNYHHLRVLGKGFFRRLLKSGYIRVHINCIASLRN